MLFKTTKKFLKNLMAFRNNFLIKCKITVGGQFYRRISRILSIKKIVFTYLITSALFFSILYLQNDQFQVNLGLK